MVFVSKLSPLLLGVGDADVPDLQELQELLAVGLVLHGQFAGVELVEVGPQQVRRDEEPGQPEEDPRPFGLVVPEEVDALVQEDGEEADQKGREDDVVARGRVHVELLGLQEEPLEGQAAEDVPAELVVAGNWEVAQAMVALVSVSLQHQSIMKPIDALINPFNSSQKSNRHIRHLEPLEGLHSRLLAYFVSRNQADCCALVDPHSKNNHLVC